MDKEEIIWSIAPHTEIKHFILKKYLGAWLPIISSKNKRVLTLGQDPRPTDELNPLARPKGISINKRVIFIDGFAGPGEYKEGNEGSPIIALKSLIGHKLELKSEFIFIFIEREKNRCAHLNQVISKLLIPQKSNIKLHVECGEFRDVITKILDDLEKGNNHMAPTFLFIDPFGFSGIPLEQIKRFMKNGKCEVLITFMLEDITRWCKLPQNEKSLTELFGTDIWKNIRDDKNLSSEEKLFALRELYKNQLKNLAEITFVRSFKMINQFNKTDYFLFFGTNHILGLERMKEAMWTIDPSGKFTFSDSTYDPRQAVLLSPTPNYSALKNEILNEFNGKKVSIEEIDNFVITKTAFLKKHRKYVLDKMEESQKNPGNLQENQKKRNLS